MPENHNTEYKQSWHEDYLKWICGFANAQGGTIFIGKDDNGVVTGLPDYKRLMDELPNKIRDILGIMVEINLLEDRGLYFIEIVTRPYDVPISLRGRYYYRSGSTKQELTGAALNDFLLRKSGKTWDDVAEPLATIDDIDDGAIKFFKHSAQLSNRLVDLKDDTTVEILTNLRLLKNNQLSRAAVLLFGKDPKYYFPTVFVKIGKFGQSDSDLLFQDVVESNVFQLADRTIEILNKKYFKSPITYEGLHRIEEFEYPYFAIRETLLNAIIHRTYTIAPVQVSVYEHKIVVWNEGRLPDGLRIEDLKKKHPSLPMNPILAEVCFKGGLIEAWGRGTIKIIEECQKAELPDPEIEVIAGGLSVTIFKDPYNIEYLKTLELNDRQLKAITRFKDKAEIVTSEYIHLFKITDRTALRDLKELVDKRLLVKAGDKKTSKYLFRKSHKS